MNQIETYNPEALGPEEWEQYVVVRQRGSATWSKDDHALLRRVRQVVPAATRSAGDMTRLAITQLVEKAGRTWEVQEGLWRSIAAQQYELGYLTAPPLERLLIEQVIINWLQLHLTQIEYTSAMAKSATVERGRYWERRLSSAHHRHLRAIQELARLRKLAVPTPLQINIGGQQVNIAGSDMPLGGRVNGAAN